MKLSRLFLIPFFMISLSGCVEKNSTVPPSSSAPIVSASTVPSSTTTTPSPSSSVDIHEERRLQYNIPTDFVSEGTWYNSKEEVAAYLVIYQKMPDNYVTNPSKPGQTASKGTFGNREGLLPHYMTYTEMDIDTEYGQARGALRIVFSNTFRVFYTPDHYRSFVEYLGYQNWTAPGQYD